MHLKTVFSKRANKPDKAEDSTPTGKITETIHEEVPTTKNAEKNANESNNWKSWATQETKNELGSIYED